MTTHIDRLMAYIGLREEPTEPTLACSQTCLCVRHVTDWQPGTTEPLAPAAQPWTPGGQR